jgi:hypothetical protein
VALPFNFNASVTISSSDIGQKYIEFEFSVINFFMICF